MTVGVTLNGLDELIAEFTAGVDEGLRVAFSQTAAGIASTARADHPYTDRTGDLTASTEGLPAQGSAMQGTLRGAVVAGMDYASYVEQGTTRSAPYPFLGPAGDANDGYLAELGEEALQRAADASTR